MALRFAFVWEAFGDLGTSKMAKFSENIGSQKQDVSDLSSKN